MDYIDELRSAGIEVPYVSNLDLNIEAMLPAAFARNKKMMRFIDDIYDSDKDFYYNARLKSDRKNSRFITANKIQIRLNAIKAQGVYMASLEDTELASKLLEHTERVFPKLSKDIKSFEQFPVQLSYILSTMDKNSNSDDYLHDVCALFFYFCRSYGMEIDKEEFDFQNTIFHVSGKEEGFLCRHADNVREGFRLAQKEDVADKFIQNMNMPLTRQKSFADMWSHMKLAGREFDFYQLVWDFVQLEDLNMSMFENETFSSKERREILDVILNHSLAGQANSDDVTLYYIAAIMIRSVLRGYKDVVAMIDEYSGIVRESEKNKKLARAAAAQNHWIIELEKLNLEKQDKLNTMQMEIDRLKRELEDRDEELALAREKQEILKQLDEDESIYQQEHPVMVVTDGHIAEHLDYMHAQNCHALVFGGPPNWQNTVKAAAPNYTCISVDNNTFDRKLIDKADVLIIKTDYLSHSQWKPVFTHAKKRGKKIVYCRNNLDLMFTQVQKCI